MDRYATRGALEVGGPNTIGTSYTKHRSPEEQRGDAREPKRVLWTNNVWGVEEEGRGSNFNHRMNRFRDVELGSDGLRLSCGPFFQFVSGKLAKSVVGAVLYSLPSDRAIVLAEESRPGTRINPDKRTRIDCRIVEMSSKFQLAAFRRRELSLGAAPSLRYLEIGTSRECVNDNDADPRHDGLDSNTAHHRRAALRNAVDLMVAAADPRRWQAGAGIRARCTPTIARREIPAPAPPLLDRVARCPQMAEELAHGRRLLIRTPFRALARLLPRSETPISEIELAEQRPEQSVDRRQQIPSTSHRQPPGSSSPPRVPRHPYQRLSQPVVRYSQRLDDRTAQRRRPIVGKGFLATSIVVARFIQGRESLPALGPLPHVAARRARRSAHRPCFCTHCSIVARESVDPDSLPLDFVPSSSPTRTPQGGVTGDSMNFAQRRLGRRPAYSLPVPPSSIPEPVGVAVRAVGHGHGPIDDGQRVDSSGARRRCVDARTAVVAARHIHDRS
ncbi:hypothetical protein DFH06DRAFT_1118026 [Mycena polygramma]|nr:hypothetical protein DFH06DRAFT_1118026 [Mycena polygramma]